ncbi:aminoglycoside phosphotransferase APH(3') [Asanoa ishikariensis]|uniref:APH(3') family aminoglycoside O-phosphotransferase n=1 Tax=Asanoa ishikariensis TaxID=137265 RepID=UPI001A612B0D|nr:APH(3') family aminoglycoside O-phosphotransferase [Asanoa ishikariensis]GIF65773.1 aminoglycoside phosphotransferase APH(3') [Asanoa ishikariensis]
MTHWHPVTTGKSTAQVWQNADAYRKQGDQDEIAAEAARLTWLATQNFPCPEVLDHTPGTLTTKALPGRPANTWPAAQRPSLSAAIGALLHDLHQLPTATCPFDRRLSTAISEAEAAARTADVDLANLDAARAGWSIERLRAELQSTRPREPEDLVVGHGDPCLPNILFTDDGRPTGVVDVARLGVADRHNDLAIATRNITANWSETEATSFLAAYGLPEPDPTKIAFYRLLDEFF